MELIADNRKARHLYQIEQTWEAGIALQGWEVKSIRAGRVQLAESHIILRNGEAQLINVHLAPLKTVSTHFMPVPDRTRKLLLHRVELDRLLGAVERKGYTLIPLNMHWRNNRVKVEVALAKGKNLYDKRQSEKQRDWQREKQQLVKLKSSRTAN